MTAVTIATALGGRRTGGGWMARCPAHDDHEPSLSISDAEDGKVLVHCHGGCPRQESPVTPPAMDDAGRLGRITAWRVENIRRPIERAAS